MCSDNGNVRIQSTTKLSMAIANGSPVFKEGVSMSYAEHQVYLTSERAMGKETHSRRLALLPRDITS